MHIFLLMFLMVRNTVATACKVWYLFLRLCLTKMDDYQIRFSIGKFLIAASVLFEKELYFAHHLAWATFARSFDLHFYLFILLLCVAFGDHFWPMSHTYDGSFDTRRYTTSKCFLSFSRLPITLQRVISKSHISIASYFSFIHFLSNISLGKFYRANICPLHYFASRYQASGCKGAAIVTAFVWLPRDFAAAFRAAMCSIISNYLTFIELLFLFFS